MKLRGKPPVSCLYAVTIFFLLALGQQVALGQAAPQKPAEKPAAKSPEKTGSPKKEENPAQIELLETKVRFEITGDSRKEVHALVKINSELGVRQFARLNFDFNRSFESVNIPLVHITHASGGTADILPGAITDQPNPAVVNAPAYQDVRVKSVRILGLQPGDTLEYRVIRTVSHHPLAPDFWLDHTFDRTGIVSYEIFGLDLPASRTVQMKVSKDLPEAQKQEEETRDSDRLRYNWKQLLRPGARRAGHFPSRKSVIRPPSAWRVRSPSHHVRLSFHQCLDGPESGSSALSHDPSSISKETYSARRPCRI